MPGLLNMDPTAAGLMALGGNMVRGDFGGGLFGFNQAIQGAQEANLKQQLGQANIADIQQQIEMRKAQVDALNRKNNLLAQFLGGGSPGVPSQSYAPGQLGSGSFGVVAPPAGQSSIPAPQSSGQGGFVSRLTPDTLAALKLGADADLTDIYKLTQPDMQVSNGYAYDRRKVQPGFLPGVNTSADGKVTVTLPGSNGIPNTIASPGSLDTFRAFEDAKNRSAANTKLTKVYNPATQREEYRTEGQAIDQATMPPAQAGVNGGFVGDPAQVMAAIQSIKDPQERANALAAFQEQARRTPGFTQGAPFAAGPSTAEAAAAAAEKERQTQIAKDITEQRKSIMNADFSAPTNIAKMQKIGQLLSDVDGGRFTPNGTEVASALNSLGIKIDKNLGNKQAAAAMANEMALQLRSPQGGAGMPGALSDKDREFLASMTPNQAQSLEGRNQVINAYVAVQRRNQQVAQFARNYEKKYGRLDNGFFDQMAAWSNAHPLFGGK